MIFLKYENDVPVGFAQYQLRYDYVEGTKTTPVGYLEGITVKNKFFTDKFVLAPKFAGVGSMGDLYERRVSKKRVCQRAIS